MSDGDRDLASKLGLHRDSGNHFPRPRLGAPFPVKAFDGPSFIIPRNTVIVEILVSQNSLVVPLQEISGGIWMLDNVDR